MRLLASTAVALILATAASAQEYPGAILPTQPDQPPTMQQPRGQMPMMEQQAQMPRDMMGQGMMGQGMMGQGMMGQGMMAQQMAMAPPGGEYKKVSEITQLPEFLPGLGSLYVQPQTIPQGGPFLAYDRQGKLVSTIYMVTTKDIAAQKKLESLDAGPLAVHHVDMYYNAGHPGVPEPHYHVVLWHVPQNVAASLK